jgi:hypothetical protein
MAVTRCYKGIAGPPFGRERGPMAVRRNRPRPRSVEHRLARREARRLTPHRRDVTNKKIATKRTPAGSVLRLATGIASLLASAVAITHHVIQMIRGA